MKKQTQMFAIMSAAAWMALLPSFAGQTGTVYAAEYGWTEEHGSMVYYDEDGELLTDTWRKEGNDWFYLNEDGHVSMNQKIDEFYVGADGKMVKNAWVELANEDDLDSPEAPASFWYYFDENGKSVTSNWVKQNEKWYYFDESGHMLTGKVNIDGSWYYLGDENDGTMKTGWIQLKENASTPDSEEGWYYFTKNGKMVETQYDRKIDGNYYTFIDGKMQTGWVEIPKAETSVAAESDAANDAGTNATTGSDTGTNATTGSDASTNAATGSNTDSATDISTIADNAASSASAGSSAPTIADYQYYGPEGDGKRANGWHTMEGIEGIHDMDETFTFYFRGGKALHSEKDGNQLFTVDGKKYAFNELGEMQTGQQIVNLADGEIANFYFGDDGVMKTGKQNIYNEETGENDVWFFYTEGDRRGQGYHGLRDNTLYVYGKRQEATSDQKYAPAVLNETTYLVNTSGNVQEASSSSTSAVKPELGRGFKDYKDNNGKVWTVDTNGIVQ